MVGYESVSLEEEDDLYRPHDHDSGAAAAYSPSRYDNTWRRRTCCQAQVTILRWITGLLSLIITFIVIFILIPHERKGSMLDSGFKPEMPECM